MPNFAGSKPRLRPWMWGMILFVLPVVALVVITTVLRKAGIIGIEGIGLLYILPTFVLSAVCSLLYWRGLDEPSREGHKFAMFWGAGFAYLFAGLFGFEMLFLSGLRNLAQGWIDGWIDFSKGRLGEAQGPVGFYLGILATFFLLGLGYLLTWIGWWARQRMGTKAD